MHLELRLAAAHVLAECDKHLRDKGISLFVSTDLSAYKQLRDREEWPAASAFFDEQLNDFLPHCAFWVGGKEPASGKIVLSQACRVDDLGGSSLRELWRIQLARWYRTDPDLIDIGRKTDALDQVSGMTAYHGDLFLAEELRGAGVAAFAARYAMACAALQWDLDWIYGLQVKSVAMSGFGMREGYLNWQPIGDEWRWGAPFLEKDDFIALMSASQLSQMFRAYHPQRNA